MAVVPNPGAYATPGKRGFRPGNPGKPPGSRHRLRHDAPERARALESVLPAEDHLRGKLLALAKVVTAESVPGGDHKAAAAATAALRLLLPPPAPKPFYITGHSDLADMPVGDRLNEIGRRLAGGTLDRDSAAVLQKSAELEINALYIRPLKAILSLLNNGASQARIFEEMRAMLTRLEAVETRYSLPKPE